MSDRLGVLVAAVCLATALVPLTSARAAPPSGQSQSAPQRIVSIAPNADEIICALGACDRLVAVSRYTIHPPELADRPRIGGLFDPNLERILALQPDLLVLRGRNETLERMCKRHDIDLFIDRTDTLADIEVTITALGRRLGRVAEADALLSKFRDDLAAIRRRTEGKRRPRVLLTISRRADRLADVLTTGRGTFLDEMITIAGGVNAFGHVDMAYPQVSPESIIARHPEVIIELMPEVSEAGGTGGRIVGQWQELRTVPAVADGRVYVLTDANVLIPSPRFVAVIDQVSRLLHPEPSRDPG